jgi:hypothetical protein
MTSLLLYLTLLLQGIPLQPNQTGTISGVLRNADGKPAANVRVAAVPQTESSEAVAGGPTLSSIAETDEQGRYKLENVPPGRYYVTAGRLDLPTYYPGSQSMALGQAVGITPGATIQGIDFVLNSTSAGRADPVFGSPGITLLDLPLEVRVEGGGKLPVWSGGTATALQLTPVLGGSVVSIPISSTRFSLAPPIVDYKVTVAGLPEGYQLKSVKYAGTELPDRTLKISGMVVRANGTITFLPNGAFSTMLGRNSGNPTPQPQVLSIVLDSAGAGTVRRTGARVSGKLPTNTVRSIYLSGLPGTVFSDGTFEFHNALPGLQMILTADNTPAQPALVARVVVGSVDLSNVELETTAVLPPNFRALSAPAPAGNRVPGTIPLASVHGRVLDSETGTALKAGTIYFIGDSWTSFDVGSEGKFEFPKLLPGKYEIEVQGVGYPTLRREVVVEDRDVDLELRAG